MNQELLLLSTSTLHGQTYLEYAKAVITSFLGSCRTLYFVPYAQADYKAYTARVQQALAPSGLEVIGLNTTDPLTALEQAEAVFVGGGNSFRLLKALQEKSLLEAVRRRVKEGTLRYIGSSAGTNMACPSLRTTNDMPIVQPRSFEAFGLLPFQINPHYLDPDPTSTHMGETREQRLSEFLEENEVLVLGLREGSWLRQQVGQLWLEGLTGTGARLFERGVAPRELVPGTDLTWLLSVTSQFDLPSLPPTGA
jgi:dipeptidase E